MCWEIDTARQRENRLDFVMTNIKDKWIRRKKEKKTRTHANVNAFLMTLFHMVHSFIDFFETKPKINFSFYWSSLLLPVDISTNLMYICTRKRHGIHDDIKQHHHDTTNGFFSDHLRLYEHTNHCQVGDSKLIFHIYEKNLPFFLSMGILLNDVSIYLLSPDTQRKTSSYLIFTAWKHW